MYKKHDSFFALKHKENKKNKHIIDRIIKTSKNVSVVKKLSPESQKILKTVTNDLLGRNKSF